MMTFQQELDAVTQSFKKCIASPFEAGETKRRLKAYAIAQVRRLSRLPALEFDHRLCNEKLLKFVTENCQTSMYLLSKKSGICKTRTMIYVAEKLFIQNKKFVFYFPAGELARAIADAYTSFGSNSLIPKLKQIDLLIVDDLGKEKLTERIDADLFEVLDYRYLHRKTTWIASNYLGNELSERFGERGPYLIRRIKETYKIYSE